jgi:hypothetical protein
MATIDLSRRQALMGTAAAAGVASLGGWPLPNRDRLVFVKDGQEFLPGIQAMSAPGHTVAIRST